MNGWLRDNVGTGTAAVVNGMDGVEDGEICTIIRVLGGKWPFKCDKLEQFPTEDIKKVCMYKRENFPHMGDT